MCVKAHAACMWCCNGKRCWAKQLAAQERAVSRCIDGMTGPNSAMGCMLCACACWHTSSTSNPYLSTRAGMLLDAHLCCYTWLSVAAPVCLQWTAVQAEAGLLSITACTAGLLVPGCLEMDDGDAECTSKDNSQCTVSVRCL